MKGKHQRKCRTHQILLIFLAVLTQLFWLPLSVNHLHITNLIQRFFINYFQVSSQHNGTGHEDIQGLHSKPKTLLKFLTTINKKIALLLLCLHWNICKFNEVQKILLSSPPQHFCSMTWLEDNLAFCPSNHSTCAHRGIHKNVHCSTGIGNSGNNICVHQ